MFHYINNTYYISNLYLHIVLNTRIVSEHSKTVSKCTKYQMYVFILSALISVNKYTRQKTAAFTGF